MFAAVMAGLGTSIVIATIAAAIGIILGHRLGSSSALQAEQLRGYSVRIGDAVSAIPVLIVAIALFAPLGANAVNTTALLGLVFIPPVIMTVHRAVRQRLGRGYVAAARLAGLSGWGAASRHVFPELARTILAKAVGLVGVGMMAETVLSFARLGVQPPTASIGLLLADAQARFLQFPHLILGPRRGAAGVRDRHQSHRRCARSRAWTTGRYPCRCLKLRGCRLTTTASA